MIPFPNFKERKILLEKSNSKGNLYLEEITIPPSSEEYIKTYFRK